MKSKLALNLPSHLQHWTEAQASARGFSTASEFIEHILMEKRQSEAKDQIERRLLEAIDQDDFFELTEARFQQLDKKLQTLVKTKPKKRHAFKR